MGRALETVVGYLEGSAVTAGTYQAFTPHSAQSFAIRASDGVTYWASCDKARRELGYAPRPLAQGLQDLLAAG